MYLAVDTVIEKIERQVKRQKDKDSDRKGRFANKTQDLVSTETVESEEFKAPPKVIRTQRMAIKPMSIDEAAMQLGLTKEDFLAFLNSETNQMNVMYKRRDGNYGLIEPEF
jgi:putative sigma-54 modulation protein